MKEIWKPISDNLEYEVSNKGVVRRRSCTLTYHDSNGEYIVDVPAQPLPVSHSSGREYVTIDGDKYFIHRLVAQEFLEKPENCNRVENIDGDLSNNSVDNLRWTTPYPRRPGQKIEYKGTGVRCLDDDLDFKTIRECANHYNMNYDRLIYAIKHGTLIDDKRIVEL